MSGIRMRGLISRCVQKQMLALFFLEREDLRKHFFCAPTKGGGMKTRWNECRASESRVRHVLTRARSQT